MGDWVYRQLTRVSGSPPLRECLVALFLIGFLLPAHGQLPVPQLHSIHPPVIPSGSTSEVHLTGVHLDDLERLLFSVPGITGTPVTLPTTRYRPHPRPDGLKFSITVPPAIDPQTVEVWAVGRQGVSTSRALVIANSDTRLTGDTAGARHHRIATAPFLPIEELAFGTLDVNEVDWWLFHAGKGDRLIMTCQAEQIDSRADATLIVVDENGRELESDRDTVGRDPMIDFTAPRSGVFAVGVHDFLYHGGPTHPYTLQITKSPWIDAVFPPVGKPGETFTATLIGRNLPGGSLGSNQEINGQPVETRQVQISVPKVAPGNSFRWENPATAQLATFPFRFENSNLIMIGLSQDPRQKLEFPANGKTALDPPFEIVSRFNHRGEPVSFRFRGKKGIPYWLEVIGDRIASRIDPYLIIERIETNGEGAETFKKISDSDDIPGKGGVSFRDGSRDASLALTPAEDGEYRVRVFDQYGSTGSDKIFRLNIREARPDFAVLAVGERSYLEKRQAYPAMPNLRRGGTFSLRLILDRFDGFTDPVTIRAEGLPAGVTAHPVTLSGRESTGRFVFAAGSEAASWAGMVQLIASARSGDTSIVRTARLGTLVWPTEDYNVSRIRNRLHSGIPLSVRPGEKNPATIQTEQRHYSVELGTKLEIPLRVHREDPKGNLAISVVDLRGLQKPPSINVAETAGEGKLVIDFTNRKGTFNPEVGTWNFSLKGTGITRHFPNPKAVEIAKAEQDHIAALVKQYSETARQSETRVENLKKALAEAEQKLPDSAPESKAELEKKVAQLRVELAEAGKAVASAEASRSEAEKEKSEVDKRLTAATKANAPKDLKFATWSEPLTVEIKPAPEEKK